MPGKPESEKSAAFIMVNIAIISIGLASKASKLELRYTCKYICMFFIVVSFSQAGTKSIARIMKPRVVCSW